MKTLFLSGPTWMFLTPEQMYDDEGALRASHRHYQNADIYFLTRMKKVRFNVDKSCVTASGQIKVVVSLGDPAGASEERTFVFSSIDLFYTLPHISKQFESRDHFLFYALLNLYKPSKLAARVAHGLGKILLTKKRSWQMGFSLMKWAHGQEVRVTHQNGFEVSIHDPLVHSLTDEQKLEQFKQSDPAKFAEMKTILSADWDEKKIKNVDFSKLPGHESRALRLTVDQVVNFYGVDVGPQEIVYIGKTERTPFERLLPHTKLQELQAKFLRNEGEAIVVHLFGFKSHDVENFKIRNSDIDDSVSVSAVESELINYFKPVMNSDYVKDDGKTKWKHVPWLRARGYGSISVQLEIENQYAKFESKNVVKANPHRHCFATDLNSFKRMIL